MKRKLSLLLAVVMILGSFSFVFGAEFDAAEFLKEKGLLVGDDSGDLMLDEPLLRKDSVVLLSRLLDEEEVAAEYEEEGLPTWEDVENPFYVPFLAWAQANEYYKGHSEVRFGYNDNLTAKQYATVLLRALGYAEEAENYDNVLEEAKELGLLEGIEKEDDEITRGEMAEMTVNALKAKVKDSEETLAEKLGVEFPEPEVPAELEVVDVKADNLKEVVVTFNQPVKAKTINDANVKIKDVKATTAAGEDGLTAIITVNDSLKNQKEYTLVVDKVETEAGVVGAKAEVKFTTFDASLPEVEEVLVTGPKHLELVFSEPIKVAGKVEIKLGNTTLGNKAIADGTNKVAIDVYVNFKEGETYTARVYDFEDFAEYKNAVNTLEFTYEKDENPPVASVTKAEQEYVIVEFDKPVKGLKKSMFWHTFSAWEAVNVYKDADKAVAVKTTDSVSKVYVYFYEGKDDKALPEGEVKFGIKGKDIKDNWSNSLGDFEATVTVAADNEAPEVTLEVDSETVIKAEFTKEVKKLTNRNVEVLDEDGKTIKGVIVNGSGKEYTITLPKSKAGKTLTVIIKDVKDTTLSENKMDIYSEEILIADKIAPEVSKAYYYKNSKDADDMRLYVVFDEEVDGDTALVAGNYTIEGPDAVLKLTKDPYFDVNSARVVIPLTEKQYNEAKKAGAKLRVINVKDIAGNTISAAKSIAIVDISTSSTVKVEEIRVTAKDTIVVKFDDLLTKVGNTPFKVTYGSGGTDNTEKYSISTAVVKGATEITLTLEKELIAADLASLVLDYNANTLENSFEEKVANLAGGDTIDKFIITGTKDKDLFKDKIAPSLASIKVDSTLINETIEALEDLAMPVNRTSTSASVVVELTFDEDLRAGAYYNAIAWLDDIAVNSNYAIEEYELDSTAPTNTLKLTITFEKAFVKDDVAEIEIELKDDPRWLMDIDENKVEETEVKFSFKVQ